MYKAMINRMEENSLDVVYCTCYRFFNDDLSIKDARYIREIFCENKEEIYQKMIPRLISGTDGNYEVTGAMWGAVYRTDIIRINNIYVEPIKAVYSEDNFFNIQYLMYAERAESINVPLYCYRNNGQSITSEIKEYTIPSLMQFKKRVVKLLSNTKIPSADIEALADIRIIVAYSVVLKKIIDANSYNAFVDYIKTDQKRYDINLHYTRENLSKVSFQVKLFWVLMRAKYYMPLYVLVKIYSKFILK